MHIVHGTWIPDDAGGFVQRGGFYVWVETDAPLEATRRRADASHPRHLTRAALATFLSEKLGLRESAPGALARSAVHETLSAPHGGRPAAALCRAGALCGGGDAARV